MMMVFTFLITFLTAFHPIYENADSTYFFLMEGESAEIIVSSKELEGDYYFSDFMGFPLLIKGQSCLILDSPELKVSKLPFEGAYSEIQWSTDTLYYSRNCEVRQYSDGEDEVLFKTECDSIQIALCEDVGLYFTQETSLCFYRLNDCKFLPLYDFGTGINDIITDALICYVASGNSIYMVADNVYEILACEEIITSVAPVTDESLFFGTHSGLYRYVYPDNCFCVVEKGVRRIRKIYDALFVVFDDGSAVKLKLSL